MSHKIPEKDILRKFLREEAGINCFGMFLFLPGMEALSTNKSAWDVGING
jgi:hypothetical protein